VIVDFTDDQARAALHLKWGVAPGVIPAWVAEMDYALAPPIADALADALTSQVAGYPVFQTGGELGCAYAGFAGRRYGHEIDPDQVIPVSDVTAGVRVAIDVLSEPGPIVLPLPAYDPQLGLAQVCGRERLDVALDPDAERADLDVAGIDAALRSGGGTVLLTQPHNPTGRVYTRAELEALRAVVVRHGARVVSDEIHAPLVLPGAEHVSYLSLPGTADHAVAVVAASKAFNTAGLRCAQLISNDRETFRRLTDQPMARNDSWSPLGVIAAIAAYTHGDQWLDALIERLDSQRSLLATLLTEQLPKARMRPVEATYLAWLDLRGYGHDNAAAVAYAGGVRLSAGTGYQPDLPGHARLNFATSPERLTEIIRRLGVAFTS
jgi:cystathionine beta-lyase